MLVPFGKYWRSSQAFGEPDQHHEPGGALDQGRDLGPA
jgi:hypothetical protein